MVRAARVVPAAKSPGRYEPSTEVVGAIEPVRTCRKYSRDVAAYLDIEPLVPESSYRIANSVLRNDGSRNQVGQDQS